MRPRVLFPDAVLIVTAWLRSELELDGEPVPVVTLVPDPRPDRFVIIYRTGGVRRDLVTDLAQVTVEAWGADEKAAHDLAQHARALVHAMPGEVIDGTTVYRVDELAGPALLPDDRSAQARYVFTAQLALRGTRL